MMHKDVKCSMIIILFIIALSVPFLDKAYHIDDTAFLFVADQISRDLFRPYSFTLEWLNGPKSGTDLLDTPLIMYHIALVSSLFGRSEIILHISYLIFFIIAGLSFYFLTKKFLRKPLIPTLTLIATPTILVNSQNLMLDVPMLSFFLLAVTLFIYGVDKDKHLLLITGSISAGFAYLAKPNAIILVPLLFLYCLLKKKHKYIAYQLIPILFITLFAIHNFIFEDKILLLNYLPFLTEARESSIRILFAYLFSNLSYIGGATIFPLFLIYPFIIKKTNLLLLGYSSLMTLVITFILSKVSENFLSGKYNLLQLSLFFIFLSVSIFFIILVVKENFNNTKSGIFSMLKNKNINYNSDNLFIFVWFMGIFILNSFISGGAVRYNTLFLPPMIIFYFLLLKKYSKHFKLNFTRLSIGILLLTTFLGLVTAYADYDYANSYRDFTNKVPQLYKTGDNIVHFIGGAGFQYYMEDGGYRMLLHGDNSPKKGDYIIKANLAFPRLINPDLMTRLQLIDTISYKGNIPIRIQNPEAHAGFYSYPGGFLPYSFSNSDLETFDIYIVSS